MIEMTNLERLANALEIAETEAKKAEIAAKAAETKAAKAEAKAETDEAKAKAAKARANAAKARAKADEAKAKAEAIQNEYDEAKAKADKLYNLCAKGETIAEAKAKAAEAEANKPAKVKTEAEKAAAEKAAAENKRKIDEAKAEAKAKAAEADEAKKAAEKAAAVALIRADKARATADEAAVKALKKAFNENKDLTAESVSDTLYNMKVLAISRRFDDFNELVNNSDDIAKAANAESKYKTAVYDYCKFIGIVNKSAFFALIGTALYSLKKVNEKTFRVPYEYKTQFRRISTLASGVLFDVNGACLSAFDDFMHNYLSEAAKAEAKAERALTAAEKDKSNFESLVVTFGIDKTSKAYIDLMKNYKAEIDKATKAKAEAKAANEAAKALTYADFEIMWYSKNKSLNEKFDLYETAKAEAEAE